MSEAVDHAYDFDPDALREKYRAERDKRIRADGNDQYLRLRVTIRTTWMILTSRQASSGSRSKKK